MAKAKKDKPKADSVPAAKPVKAESLSHLQLAQWLATVEVRPGEEKLRDLAIGFLKTKKTNMQRVCCNTRRGQTVPHEADCPVGNVPKP